MGTLPGATGTAADASPCPKPFALAQETPSPMWDSSKYLPGSWNTGPRIQDNLVPAAWTRMQDGLDAFLNNPVGRWHWPTPPNTGCQTIPQLPYPTNGPARESICMLVLADPYYSVAPTSSFPLALVAIQQDGRWKLPGGGFTPSDGGPWSAASREWIQETNLPSLSVHWQRDVEDNLATNRLPSHHRAPFPCKRSEERV